VKERSKNGNNKLKNPQGVDSFVKTGRLRKDSGMFTAISHCWSVNEFRRVLFKFWAVCYFTFRM